jgi:YVTN family beta-propeller protein
VPAGGLVPIDPVTGEPGEHIDVQDVYNLYFTPDGAQAIVVAEHYRRLDFYDPVSWQPTKSLELPECGGINHMDYSADGRTMLFRCEFANRLLALDGETHEEIGQFDLDEVEDGMPQDVRLTPDGQHFLVADMRAHGVYAISTAGGKLLARIPVGSGPHGLAVWPQPGRYSLGHTGNIR